jgi:hypothetical protein
VFDSVSTTDLVTFTGGAWYRDAWSHDDGCGGCHDGGSAAGHDDDGSAGHDDGAGCFLRHDGGSEGHDGDWGYDDVVVAVVLSWFVLY